MKNIRRKVVSADRCEGSGGAFWELFLECGHVKTRGGYSRCPKTTVCSECKGGANKALKEERETALCVDSM